MYLFSYRLFPKLKRGCDMEREKKGIVEKKVYEGCSVSYFCDGICREKHFNDGDCSCFYRFRLERLRNKKGKLLRRYSQKFIR